jgi:hydrogenase/urease accessory protein HupE
VFCLIASFIVSASNLFAHQTNTSYVSLTVKQDQIEVMLTFDLTDLNKAFKLDADQDGSVNREELLNAMPQMYEYFAPRFTLAIGYTPVELEQQEGGFTQDDFGNLFINFLFIKKTNAVPGELGFSVDYFEKLGEDHKVLAKIVYGDKLDQAVFTREEARRRFIVGGEVTLGRQLREFTILGVEHIFLGYDHLMFLLGLLLLGGRFGNLVKIVTSFTLAHSLTLICAALEILSLPGRLVESGIALSIAYVGAENFLLLGSAHKTPLEESTKHRWILTFCFGLVHGFGFANVLRDLGLPAKGLIGSLLAFNLGVEIGQVAIVALLFPLVLYLTRERKPAIYSLSAIILLFGVLWFVERIAGLEFMPI